MNYDRTNYIDTSYSVGEYRYEGRIYREHRANHLLPAFRGQATSSIAQQRRVPYVSCGRCKVDFAADAVMINEKYDKDVAQVRGRGGFDPWAFRPFTEAENLEAIEGLENDRRHFLAMLEPVESQ